MLISLSPTIFDAGQLFRGRGEGAKSTVQDQKKFISKCAPLSKLIHNHTSPDGVARLSRWYKGKLLPEEDTESWNSYLFKVGSLVGYGLGLFQDLDALSEKANALHTAFNALAPEEQEYEQPRIQEKLQAIYAEQQTIYALLDRAPEENREDSPVLKKMQEMGMDLVSTGLMQHMQVVNQELLHIEQEEEPHITSLAKYVVSVPRTETVIGSIAALVGALGVILQIPTIVCVLSAFLAISMIIIRCVKSIISDKHHAKKHDMLILQEVMSQYMETVNNAIRAIFQIKQDTTDIKGTLGRLEEKINNAPPPITYNVIQVVDPKYLLPPEQQLLLAQGSATRPAITLSREGQESAKTLVNYQPRAHKTSFGSVTSNSSSASASPIIGRFPSPEIEEEDSSFTQHNASSSKGKGRAEPIIFEEPNIDELLSSDSESDSDEVLTAEEKTQLKKARAQRKAEKNAKIRAFALQFEEQQKKINKQAAILNALGVNVN